MFDTAPYSLADTRRLNNRVNLRLLEPLSEEQLAHAPGLRAQYRGPVRASAQCADHVA
jgi:hypothetical protein